MQLATEAGGSPQPARGRWLGAAIVPIIGRMYDDELTRLLAIQDGVVSRSQLLAIGLREHDLQRLLRRRDLTKVHPGVYVDHTGVPSWQQRAWAAVLVHWPAALARESALPHPPEAAPIQVAIDVRRTVARLPGVRAHRTPGFGDRVMWRRSPPRIALEHAAIDVAAAAPNRLAAFHALAEVCRGRETSPSKIQAVLTERRVAHGRWLRDLLADLACGACSVLEREYLLLERRHGLPRGMRQNRSVAGGRTAFRDVEYVGLATIVELDGRPFHDTSRQRDRDFERDLDAAVAGGALTVRLTFGQVFGNGCRTAIRVGTLLQRRGWTGAPRRCPQCPDS